ncbi:MAG TPA: hypothetical protein VMB50_14600 [Myxococcales bacterium]|nr:hypothetical protein [Myxococcales bacterium]
MASEPPPEQLGPEPPKTGGSREYLVLVGLVAIAGLRLWTLFGPHPHHARSGDAALGHHLSRAQNLLYLLGVVTVSAVALTGFQKMKARQKLGKDVTPMMAVVAGALLALGILVVVASP